MRIFIIFPSIFLIGWVYFCRAEDASEVSWAACQEMARDISLHMTSAKNSNVLDLLPSIIKSHSIYDARDIKDFGRFSPSVLKHFRYESDEKYFYDFQPSYSASLWVTSGGSMQCSSLGLLKKNKDAWTDDKKGIYSSEAACFIRSVRVFKQKSGIFLTRLEWFSPFWYGYQQDQDIQPSGAFLYKRNIPLYDVFKRTDVAKDKPLCNVQLEVNFWPKIDFWTFGKNYVEEKDTDLRRLIEEALPSFVIAWQDLVASNGDIKNKLLPQLAVKRTNEILKNLSNKLARKDTSDRGILAKQVETIPDATQQYVFLKLDAELAPALDSLIEWRDRVFLIRLIEPMNGWRRYGVPVIAIYEWRENQFHGILGGIIKYDENYKRAYAVSVE